MPDMRVLLLDSFPPVGTDHEVPVVASEALRARGHDVDTLDLLSFNHAMTAEEHTAYQSDDPVVSDDVRESVSRLQAAQALLFCYPTVGFTVPSTLKGWLERVFVPGVAFVLDERHRIRPKLSNIRRIGAVTTSPHGRIARMLNRDAGKLITIRSTRAHCRGLCRTTFLSLPTPIGQAGRTRIRRTLSRW